MSVRSLGFADVWLPGCGCVVNIFMHTCFAQEVGLLVCVGASMQMQKWNGAVVVAYIRGPPGRAHG